MTFSKILFSREYLKYSQRYLHHNFLCVDFHICPVIQKNCWHEANKCQAGEYAERIRQNCVATGQNCVHLDFDSVLPASLEQIKTLK